MTSRRHVLSLLSVAPFAPGLAACAAGDLPDPVAGWRDPGASEADPRRFALAYAILAANPHNTQPWQAELVGDDEMLLYCDLERRLPFTDPLDRQITIGCGVFLDFLRTAAEQRGFYAQMTQFPDGEPLPRLDARPFAHVKFTQAPVFGEGGDGAPILNAITSRRTNRSLYEVTRPPQPEALDELVNAVADTGEEYAGGVYWATEAPRVAQIRDLVWRAFEREMQTVGALEETYRWLRFGREEIARHRDGLAIEGAMMPLFKALGFVSHDAMVDPNSQSNRSALADWKKKADSAPAFLWFTTLDDTPTSRLSAGRAYGRLAIAAQMQGLSIHPWSQALQEYEEMADLKAEARELLNVGGETLQMLVRVGYADQTPPSARRALEDFIRA